ncbi:hypothetical protein DDB_G0285801 [Dictyostelium discoideum AX4]|uniref:Uncharacterized protein n=1 Tax=Dictyostelium discoideum TaxID=44689 RepID=B0G152_DICDI|nr:hypothetical protein DDB_G0285801 [Dictyostelium discoideum AX4]EDR41054.1 hypothetical protein DDB_G0285801 [Dictyostelium discoideum AX4]|eukprot:XP_001733015.1 hypothetical protein DDB_G0285801 [Dictyostelium discoideum AX4]
MKFFQILLVFFIVVINLIKAQIASKFQITILNGCDQTFTAELDKCSTIGACGFSYAKVTYDSFMGDFTVNMYKENMFRCNEAMPDNFIIFDCGSGSSFPGQYSIKCIKPSATTATTTTISTTSHSTTTTTISTSSTTSSTTNGNTISSGDSGSGGGTKSSTTAHLFSSLSSTSSSSTSPPPTTTSTTTSTTSSSSTSPPPTTASTTASTTTSTTSSSSTTGGVSGATCEITSNSSLIVSYIANTPYIQCNGSPDLNCNGLCSNNSNYTRTCYANKFINCSGISIKCSIDSVEVCKVHWQYDPSSTTSTSEVGPLPNHSISNFNFISTFYITFILLTIFQYHLII